MTTHTSLKIYDNLYLVHQHNTDDAHAAPAPGNVNHIVVVDCSGSMYGTLPELRNALKLKLPSLLKEGDTISIIWFSGRSEFGVLLEAETVSTLKELARVNAMIDRWLKPNGLTGFKEPLQEADKLIARVAKKNSNPFNLFFMSDGQDNQWSRDEILRTVTALSTRLISSTFVEYGYYADRPMLTAMAQQAGGELIFANAFEKYEPAFEKTIKKQFDSAVRRTLVVPSAPVGGFVFDINFGEQSLTTYAPTAQGHELVHGTIAVSGEVTSVWWLAQAPVGQIVDIIGGDTGTNTSAMYAALSLYAVRMQSDVVFPLLRAIGDARFIKMYATCFGKQAYSRFMEEAQRAVFSASQRMLEGYNPNLVPADDAFTVFDLLKLLDADDKTRVMLDHPTFEYSRISRRTVDADENLSADEQKQVSALADQIKKTRSVPKAKELQAQIDAIMASKRKALEFKALNYPDGYEISSLTYNEQSPNISILVKKEGTVDLSERLQTAPADVKTLDWHLKTFPTFIYRNYSIVAHGIVNVTKLPVKISTATYRKLADAGVSLAMGDTDGEVTIIDLSTLPILNRKTVMSVKLADTVALQYELTKRRAWSKVYKDVVKEKYPAEKLIGFTAKYGEAAATWLKEECGITEYSGFNPSRVQAESTDFITGRELLIKLKGYSTLPTVKAVREKMQKVAADKAGKVKLNGPETMMAEALTDIAKYMSNTPEKLHKGWLVGRSRFIEAENRALSHQLSQIVFSVIVGQTWFGDVQQIDEAVEVTASDGTKVTGNAELREIQIKL